jgi:hypothetical protein
LIGVTLASVDIKWNNLTQLDAKFCVDEVLEIFHLTHHLVRCELICIPTSAARYRISETPVLLRYLQHLGILSYSAPDAYEIMNAITTPSLRHLDLDVKRDALPVHGFKSFITRSKCDLEGFDLTGSIAEPGGLIDVLRYLPSSLEQLSLRPKLDVNPRPWLTEEVWNLFKSARNHDGDASKGRFFPNLKLFMYNGPQTFSWPEVIPTFLGHHSVSCAANPGLLVLYIMVVAVAHRWPVELIDPDSLRIIHKPHSTAIVRIIKWDPEISPNVDLIESSMRYHAINFD